MRGSLAAAMVTQLAIVTYRNAKRPAGPLQLAGVGLPLPSQYVATVGLFGALGFASGPAEGPASLFGWAVVLASLLNLWQVDPTGKVSLGPAPASSASTSPKTTKGKTP